MKFLSALTTGTLATIFIGRQSSAIEIEQGDFNVDTAVVDPRYFYEDVGSNNLTNSRMIRSIGLGSYNERKLRVRYSAVEADLSEELKNQLAIIKETTLSNDLSKFKGLVNNEYFKQHVKSGIDNFATDGNIRKIVDEFYHIGDCLQAAMSYGRLAAEDSVEDLAAMNFQYYQFVKVNVHVIKKFRSAAFVILNDYQRAVKYLKRGRLNRVIEGLEGSKELTDEMIDNCDQMLAELKVLTELGDTAKLNVVKDEKINKQQKRLTVQQAKDLEAQQAGLDAAVDQARMMQEKLTKEIDDWERRIQQIHDREERERTRQMWVKVAGIAANTIGTGVSGISGIGGSIIGAFKKGKKEVKKQAKSKDSRETTDKMFETIGKLIDQRADINKRKIESIKKQKQTIVKLGNLNVHTQSLQATISSLELVLQLLGKITVGVEQMKLFYEANKNNFEHAIRQMDNAGESVTRIIEDIEEFEDYEDDEMEEFLEEAKEDLAEDYVEIYELFGNSYIHWLIIGQANQIATEKIIEIDLKGDKLMKNIPTGEKAIERFANNIWEKVQFALEGEQKELEKANVELIEK